MMKRGHVAKKLTEPRRTPEEIRAQVVRMLDGKYAIASRSPGLFVSGAAAELERLLKWIDGEDVDAWG